MCVFDEHCTSEVARHLREIGHNIEFFLVSGQIVLVSQQGKKPARDAISQIEKELTAQEGYNGVRICIQHRRQLASHSKDLGAMERELARVIREAGARLLCFYERESFGSEILLNQLQNHPGVYSDGVEKTNPYTSQDHTSSGKLNSWLQILQSYKLDERERRYYNLFLSAPDVVYALSGDDTITDLNPVFESLTGWPVEDWIGKPFHQLIHPDDLPMMMHRQRQLLEGRALPPIELRVKTRCGTYIHCEFTGTIERSNGAVVGILGIARDITARKRVEEALRESQDRYALAAMGANDGLWDWNIQTENVYYSSRWKTMLGISEDITNSIEEWFQRIHPEDLPLVKSDIAVHLRSMTPHFESEHRMMHKDGSYRWVLSRGIAVLDKEGNPLRMAGSQTDITQRKNTEKQLLHDALHDALTKLPNRPLIMDRLQGAMNRARRRENYTFAVLFVDLDRFKLINDSLGHLVGDEVLRQVAFKLQSCLRPEDTVARLGGDEFAILLDEIHDITDAVRVSKRIQETLALPFTIEGQEIYTALSIGIAINKKEYTKPEDILRDADTAMYRAKAMGKNQHQLFATAMHRESVEMLHLENSLRRAIDRQEFELFYMPILALKTGGLIGFEALIRWRDPERGLLMPDLFIPKLEETGLIEAVGEWTLRQACTQLQFWQTEGCPPIKMSVNLSAKQFSNSTIFHTVEKILHETGISPCDLILEITETTIAQNPDQTTITLQSLRDLGVQLHIDDFGTGYSSLSYLMRFPLNALKIDRSFVMALTSEQDSSEVLRAIISLARNLNLEVIAEGAETPYQVTKLQKMGCDYAQGYFFSPAVNAREAGDLLRAGNKVNTNVFPAFRHHG